MAIETIKCQECGSADVAEFKPGSYVCSHCDAVFKHLDPSRVSQEECTCGTFAVGHCSECNAPVCGIHSKLWDKQRLCESHAKERQEQSDQLQRIAERERAMAEQERAIAEQERAPAVAIARQRAPSDIGLFLKRMGEAGFPGTTGFYAPVAFDELPRKLQKRKMKAFEADRARATFGVNWNGGSLPRGFSSETAKDVQQAVDEYIQGKLTPNRAPFMGWVVGNTFYVKMNGADCTIKDLAASLILLSNGEFHRCLDLEDKRPTLVALETHRQGMRWRDPWEDPDPEVLRCVALSVYSIAQIHGVTITPQ